MNLDLSARPRLSSPRLRPALLCGLAFPVSLALAQTSGTWISTTGGDWSNTANWSGGTVATGGSTSANVTATFSASGTQTVNLDTNQTVQTLAFSTGTYTLSSSNGSVLTLAGSSTPVVASSGTISATLAGTQGFNMNPGGIRNLTLSGNNTYTGVTTMSGGGMIYVKSNNALGATGTGNGTTINYTSGSAVQLHILNNVTSGEDITVNINSSGSTGGNLIYNDSGNNTLTGNITLGRYSPNSTATTGVNTFGFQSTAGTLTINGNISGSAASGQADGSVADQSRLQFRPTAAGAAIKVNGVISDGTLTASSGTVGGGANGGLSVYTTSDSLGTVTFTNANTYTGSTVINGGTLALTGTGSIANSTIYSIGAGAKFDASGLTTPGYSLATVATTLGVGATTNGFINVGAGALTLGNALTLNFSALPTASTFNLYDSSSVSGDFTSVTLTGSVTGSLALGGGIWSGTAGGYNLSLDESSGILTVVSAVPEPATYAALAGLAAIGAVVAGRRRRS